MTNKFSPGRFPEIEQLFFGLNACFMVVYRWTFYRNILGEFKLLLRSNAEIVVFFDVLTRRKIYLILVQLFQVKIQLRIRQVKE